MSGHRTPHLPLSADTQAGRLQRWCQTARLRESRIFLKSLAILKLQCGILEVYYMQMQGPNT